MPEIRAIPVEGIGDIKSGDDLAAIILAVAKRDLRRGDVLVVTHKVVSKAEGQIVPLASVRPESVTSKWAKQFGLDPRVVQLGLDDASRVVRQHHGVTITETKHGFICANSGVDASNVDGGHSAVLLPRDPDASARKLFRSLKAKLGFPVPVIISDSFGRPWREGLTEIAIGVAGMRATRDSRGKKDPYGYKLRVTLEAVADEIAGVAGLACGKLTRIPVCIVRGFAYQSGRGSGRELIRAADRDLFR